MEPKSIKNQFKNRVQNGRHLDIDFYQILVTFGRQVGMENPLKIDPKRDQKNDRRLEYVLGRLRENLGGFWRISGGSGGG